MNGGFEGGSEPNAAFSDFVPKNARSVTPGVLNREVTDGKPIDDSVIQGGAGKLNVFMNGGTP